MEIFKWNYDGNIKWWWCGKMVNGNIDGNIEENIDGNIKRK